jgi:hypothetical protein
MNLYQQTTANMTTNANAIKEVIIAHLAKDGLLKGDPARIAARYVLVAYEFGWFGKAWAKVTGVSGEGVKFRVFVDPVVSFESEAEK